MKHTIRKLYLFLLLIGVHSSILYATTADELISIHKVTTDEMNSIITPQAGSLVYNTTVNTLYFYTGTVWKRMKSSGAETIIIAGSNIVITGNGSSTIPYIIGQ